MHAIMEPIDSNATMPLRPNSNDVNPCLTPNGITMTSNALIIGAPNTSMFLMIAKKLVLIQ